MAVTIYVKCIHIDVIIRDVLLSFKQKPTSEKINGNKSVAHIVPKYHLAQRLNSRPNNICVAL